MKRIISILLAVTMLVTFAGCGSSANNANNNFKVAMVTNSGGVNDESFNESAWLGLQEFSRETGAEVTYLESNQATDYITNLDKLADQNCNLIYAVGFVMADSVLTASASNPEINYAIIDYSYGDETPSNVTCIIFRAQESAFVVGYIAGMTTKTNKVGFVGGIKGIVIDQFEYGYRAGVDYAAKELGKSIDVSIQYIESFTDTAKAKATASKMFSDGCDIIFHAAGGAGVGVIEAAKDSNKFVIGVDKDQSNLAPGNVLTSALKLVNNAVNIISTNCINGDEIGGITLTYGLKEDCVGIPENNPNMDQKVYENAIALEQKVKDGDIIPPCDKESYESFKNNY